MGVDGGLESPINIVENGHLVSRRSDFIIYSVEAEYVDEVVKAYGPCIPLRGG
jgi:prephenate dehydrogenase (NADP+)